MCFRKIYIKPEKEDNLISYNKVDKIKPRAKLNVDENHVVVCYKDNVVGEVYKTGLYNPLTKQDKKYLNIVFAFVSTKKSKLVPFSTRLSDIRDVVTGEVYSASFSGKYSFSVRNERKFIGNFLPTFEELSEGGFALTIENDINSRMLPFILDYFAKNKISFKHFNKHKENVERHLLINLSKYLDDTYGVEAREVKLENIDMQPQFALK